MLITKVYQLWKILLVAILTEIRAHRNKVIFKNGVVDSVEIFSQPRSEVETG